MKMYRSKKNILYIMALRIKCHQKFIKCGALEWKITLCSSLILNCFLASEKSSMRGWGRQMIKVMNASFGLN